MSNVGIGKFNEGFGQPEAEENQDPASGTDEQNDEIDERLEAIINHFEPFEWEVDEEEGTESVFRLYDQQNEEIAAGTLSELEAIIAQNSEAEEGQDT